MARFLKNRKQSQGSSPGSLIFLGRRKMEESQMNMVIYSKDILEERKLNDLSDIPDEIPENGVLWLNIYGLQDVNLIARIGERFSIEPLELEDILNPDQRPKISENEHNLTIFLKVMEYREDLQHVYGDQVSIVTGSNYVITFQEVVANIFDPVRERLRQSRGKIRSSGPDYLTYALIDTLVDSYIQTIESLGSSLEAMETEVLHDTEKKTMHKIYRMKTHVGFVRKNILPLKEIMFFINKNDSGIFSERTLTYVKDLQDLSTQALEAIDIYYNMSNDYLNIYHANVGNRTNDVMKVLTIFASIFIPLTFIAGVYGTNFEYLPELHYKYSYYVMWGVMIIVAGVMLYYFKRKNWL